MPLNDSQKAVVTRYKSYIQKGDYEGFFGNIRTAERYIFADFLYFDAGINFLLKMKNIPDGLFMGSERIDSIVIPKNIVRVGNSAFASCPNLQEVEIESGVQSIAPNAFKNCPKLSTVVIGEGLQSIGGEAFRGDASLEKIYLPESTFDLGNGVFAGCDRIVIVTEYRPEGSTNRLRVKQSDIPFYKQHLKFTHKKTKKEEPKEQPDE